MFVVIVHKIYNQSGCLIVRPRTLPLTSATSIIQLRNEICASDGIMSQ